MHENILTLYSTQLSIPQSHADVTRPTYVTYTIPTSATGKEDQLIVSERKSLLSADGHTGSRTWEAALALGEYFLSNETSLAKPVSECRILELGAGTAFTSILLAKLKARRVLATDGSEAVCEAIRTNLELNGLGESDSITASELLWGPDEHDNRIYGEPWDLIVGGDITYDSRDLEALVYTLKLLLEMNRKNHAVGLISATVRNIDTIKEFERLLGVNDFEFAFKEHERGGQTLWYYGSDTPIRIYHLKLKQELS